MLQIHRHRLIIVVFALSVFARVGSPGETPGTKPARKASLSELNFIQGHWVTEVDGGQLEEIWSAPAGDSLMGMFRWLKEGKVWLYEILTIRAEEDGIRFRFRHFSETLVPWEPKDKPLTFKLISLEDGEAVFENPLQDHPRRYSFIKDGDNRLRVRIQAFRDGDLTPGDVFYYRRR
jgi:hypothetical protein